MWGNISLLDGLVGAVANKLKCKRQSEGGTLALALL